MSDQEVDTLRKFSQILNLHQNIDDLLHNGTSLSSAQLRERIKAENDKIGAILAEVLPG